MRILYIEDVAIYHRMVRKIVESLGNQLVTAATGAEGLKAAQESAFDMILLDINLPDVDGLMLIRQMRELKPDAPIIAITANAVIDAKNDCLEAGASDYISKPFTYDGVAALIQRYAR